MFLSRPVVTPVEGYIVSFPDGKLAFVVFNRVISAIKAGPAVTPSNCGG
jgi:hypothetical protein